MSYLVQLCKSDGLVKSQHHPSTLRPFDRLTAQGESREARDNLLIFRSAELAEA